VGGEVEEAADVVLVVEFAPIVVAGPSLGPDQIDGGAGTVLPAENQIGAEFQEVEIGIPESVVCFPVQAFIDMIGIGFVVVAYFFRGVEMIAIGVTVGPG
jgi:hypothetical protein